MTLEQIKMTVEARLLLNEVGSMDYTREWMSKDLDWYAKAYAKEVIENEMKKYKREQNGLEIVHQDSIRVLEQLLKTIE